MSQYIGIDVGGTNLRLGIVDFDTDYHNCQPKLIEESRFHADFSNLCKLNQHSPEFAWKAILNNISSAIESMKIKYPIVSAVGIGFPGFIDPSTQKIAQSPNLPGLTDVDLSSDLSRLIELPVITENDALAAAYGEYSMQSSQTSNLLYLGLGTGVGGGLILNDKPYQGQHGVAMEVGHIITQYNGRLCGCGNHGCMEQYASASGVAISYFEATGEMLTAYEISERAKVGDVNAITAYAIAAKALAQALAHILKVIDITNVVIGGGMSAGWVHMEPYFTKQLQDDLIPTLQGKVEVTISSMGDQAGIIGAAMLAQQKVMKLIS